MGCAHSQPSPIPTRTSVHTTYMLQCSERHFEGPDKHYPVKLVILDLDETLTLTTFMPRHLQFPPHLHAAYTMYNFESPFVEGDRVAKIKECLTNIAKGHKARRTLAVLTKNEAGLSAVLGLLEMAGLATCFSAVWTMPFCEYEHCGVYWDDGKWQYYSPPGKPRDHKADVLHRICKDPAAWFPQLKGAGKAAFKHLQHLRPEGVVLVDDQRANFQSPSGLKVLRYCKVARYDADYHTFGIIKDMGGIGAHCDSDYNRLTRFVETPWMWSNTMKVECHQRNFVESHKKRPVVLVVFDFDETLTIATFMPDDPACAKQVGWTPTVASTSDNLSKEDLVTYNFESPYVKGSRVTQLRNMLAALRAGGRTLAVLTKNESGIVAVLNLLKIAGLADYFDAMWSLPWREDVPNGVYQEEDSVWNVFEPPVDELHEHKADILLHLVEEPSVWFPQIGKSGIIGSDEPKRTRSGNIEVRPEGMEGIVLVDDQRTNFRSDGANKTMVLRTCKVPRYDDIYRDCGLLNQLGGIGAHDSSDFATLARFVEEPWEFPWPTEDEVVQTQRTVRSYTDDECPTRLTHHEEELPRHPRRRITDQLPQKLWVSL